MSWELYLEQRQGNGPRVLRRITPTADYYLGFDANKKLVAKANGTSSSATLTTPIIASGLTASGVGSNDFSGSTGTMKASTGGLILPAGTTSVAPLKFQSGTNLTSAVAGGVEWDGASRYFTNDTTAGRMQTVDRNYFRLTSNGSTISNSATTYYGTTSGISLVASAFYEIDFYAYFLNTTSGTVQWSLVNSAAPTSQNVYFEMSPVTGITDITAGVGIAGMLTGNIVNDATANRTLNATAALTTAVNHFAHFKIWLQNGSGTSLTLKANKSAGTITPLVGSYWTATRLPAASTGTFS